MDTATSNTGGGSAFASDSSTNLATVIKGLKKFDGKDPAEFKTWMKKFCVVLGVTRKDILPLLKKQRKPDPADTAAFDSYTRANEDLYAILFLLVELPAALSIQKHEDDTGISGDGQAAFEELCNNYDRVTDEVIRAKMEELENNPMNPGANPDNGRSTTGYLFFLAGGPISYGAKTQTLTAQSTVEAEIQALSYSAREAVYISNFMTELNFKTFGSVPINSDSTGALTVAGNAMHSQRTKHVALRYFFIRELVLRGQITLHHRPSEHQLADIATKYLPKHRFASIIQQIKDFSC